MAEDFWDALVTGVWFADRSRPGANPVLASIWFDVLVAENGHLAVGAVLSDTAPRTRSTGAIATRTGPPTT
ncbi:hypothetical protein [Saccharopolyspora endophytica]|uniref:Uncharacterized protein n=1 Tax=Saccharopolyspora endophytica TaxID=543886 RepID=A0ABS5DL63_9PSEU|nr:hypothetical protein [Saccharopolyspora endophytica]MBQ0927017.1 hypothetical protein [Saccharopolyspora endophytica]